jgi:hypothetical protein
MRIAVLRNPGTRLVIVRRILSRIRPDWSAFKPVVTEVKPNGATNQFNGLINILGYAGEGGSHAMPYLITGLTNASSWANILALQSLEDLGTNSLPALPYLIDDLTNRRWNMRHLYVLRTLGPLASDALPHLKALNALPTAPSGAAQEIAMTILGIDPTDAGAFELVQKELVAGQVNVSGRPKIDPWSALFGLFKAGEPNAAIAGLAAAYLQNAREPMVPLQLLLKHDPDEAVSIMHQLLNDGTDRSTMLWLLLNHDPNDPVALIFLRGKIQNNSLHQDPLAASWFYPLQNCLSDSPGVMEMLDYASGLELSDRVREQVELTRRHIELNDQLRELRKKE